MKYIIFGTSVFSRLIEHYIKNDTDDTVLAYTVDSDYVNNDSFNGTPLIRFGDLEKRIDMSEATVLISIGYKNMNDLRKEVFERCDELGYNIGNFIHPSARVSGVSFGRGNIVMPCAVFQPYVTVGNANVFCENTMVEQETIIGNYNFVGPKSFLGAFVKMYDNNNMGIGSIIGDKISVGNYNLVGSGAVLNTSLTNYYLVAPDHSRIKQLKKHLLDAMVNSI